MHSHYSHNGNLHSGRDGCISCVLRKSCNQCNTAEQRLGRGGVPYITIHVVPRVDRVVSAIFQNQTTAASVQHNGPLIVRVPVNLPHTARVQHVDRSGQGRGNWEVSGRSSAIVSTGVLVEGLGPQWVLVVHGRLQKAKTTK